MDFSKMAYNIVSLNELTAQFKKLPGIGEKTALKLISEYESLEKLYEAVPSAPFTPSQNKKLSEGRDSAFMSQRLARIICDVPIVDDLEQLAAHEINKAEAYKLFTRLEFSAFIKRFDLDGANEEYSFDQTEPGSKGYVRSSVNAEELFDAILTHVTAKSNHISYEEAKALSIEFLQQTLNWTPEALADEGYRFDEGDLGYAFGFRFNGENRVTFVDVVDGSVREYFVDDY